MTIRQLADYTLFYDNILLIFTSQTAFDILCRMVDMPQVSLPNLKKGPLLFIKEVHSELLKIVWPTKTEVIKLTMIVIAASIVIGLYIGGLDLILTKVTDLIIKR